MARLPSYGEALAGGHWLDIVAPCVAFRDYARVCLVSYSFYDEFAPRLWNDPLQMARLLGLLPDHALEWYLYFVTRHCQSVRPATRRLITCLDFRGFTSASPALLDGLGLGVLSETLRRLRSQFPSVRSLLLDGLACYDPIDLVQGGAGEADNSQPAPLVLSLSRCSLPLPSSLFLSPYWCQLVYLDLSEIPGTPQGLLPPMLPNLRILKIRGREIKDASLSSILSIFSGRLWSLDLERNSLTDDVVNLLGAFLTLPAVRTDAYFEVEGRIANVQDGQGNDIGSDAFGAFSYIAESRWSADFSHPERHLADSPAYDPQSPWRLNGREALRSDRAEDVKAALAGGAGKLVPDWHDVLARDEARLPCALSHVHLSGNRGFTVNGLEQLLWLANGHLRHVDCASPEMCMPVQTTSRLMGVLGCSHLFRPVLASNLQSLRIHHSLVTQVLTVTDPTRSPMGNLAFAETVLLERALIAFPLAFVPDMNPRLQSLTLTCLPRASSGPLIDRLVTFLVLVARQEASLQSTLAYPSHRSPSVLRGLRHVRLEFEAQPGLGDGRNGLGTLDLEALLRPSAGDFSFFGQEAWERAWEPERGSSTRDNKDGLVSHSERVATALDGRRPARLAHYPLPGTIGGGELVGAPVRWKNKETHVSVWVGSGIPGARPALNAYMAHLAHPWLRTHVRPATPDQVVAGVPAGSCVFSAAWTAMLATGTTDLMDRTGVSGSMTETDAAGVAQTNAPGHTETGARPMCDVVQAIRQFRTDTRAAGEGHWSGTLELLLAGSGG